MTKKMKIKLLPNGEIQMETQGVKGKKCLEYIEVFKKLSGARVLSTELSQEYYEEENYNEIDAGNNMEIHLD